MTRPTHNHTYYFVDPATGNDANDGLSPAAPFQTALARPFGGGDTVLFKRGSVIRGPLHAGNGTADAPLTYGAYGTGPKPVFLGSVSAGDPARWVAERPGLWRYTGVFSSEVGNLIFNHGQSCGNLRWELSDLRLPGEWHYTGLGCKTAPAPTDALYLVSPTNPGHAYTSIECALWGERCLVHGKRQQIFENLRFENAAVHAYQGIGVENITFRHCEFRFIGGAVWEREPRIRFGNAIEFWDGARDCTVEHCYFDNIYDSGVTHQGGLTTNIPHHLYYRHNEFRDCGMSAYELREPAYEVYFEHNRSFNAGGGFSPQGEPPPRQSEIHPQPMGHHVFIWRIDPGTQPGAVYIRHNLFSEAPDGAAIYSIIDPADERRLILDHNTYRQTTGNLLLRWGGRNYTAAEFARYQAESGQDAHSQLDSAAKASGD